MEISFQEILEAMEKDAIDDNYKPTIDQIRFQNFVSKTLEKSVTVTGNITSLAFFHLAERLQIHVRHIAKKYKTEQLNSSEIRINKLNSFEIQIYNLAMLVGFDVMLIVYHLKSQKKFTQNNFQLEVDKVKFVRDEYSKTLNIFRKTGEKIAFSIKSIVKNEISPQVESITLKLAKINDLINALPDIQKDDSFHPVEFIGTTNLYAQHVAIEKNRITKLLTKPKSRLMKLNSLYDYLEDLNIMAYPHKGYHCKENYQDISDLCNILIVEFKTVNEPELIGKSIEILDTERSRFLGILSTIFELIKEPENDNDLEAEKSNSLVESGTLQASANSPLAFSSAFFTSADHPARLSIRGKVHELVDDDINSTSIHQDAAQQHGTPFASP